MGLLKLIPGTPAAVLEFMLDQFDGLVIESFGVGGLPEYEGDASYFDIIHRGIARGKLVVMTTQVPNEGSNLAVYHVGGRLKSALCLLEAYDMTTEAAVAKLCGSWGRPMISTRRRGCFTVRWPGIYCMRIKKEAPGALPFLQFMTKSGYVCLSCSFSSPGGGTADGPASSGQRE